MPEGTFPSDRTMPIVGKMRRARKSIRGVAAVELAICLPLLVVFTFASIELCSALYLRQSLTIAAYEGVRVACHPQGLEADATQSVNRILTERRINGGQITFTPTAIDGVADGTLIRVTVRAPAASNSLLRFGLFGSNQISASCSMRKE